MIKIIVLKKRETDDDIHHEILVSDTEKGWTDIPWLIDTPKNKTPNNYKEQIIKDIQFKLDRGKTLDNLKEMSRERKIQNRMRELAEEDLKAEGEL